MFSLVLKHYTGRVRPDAKAALPPSRCHCFLFVASVIWLFAHAHKDFNPPCVKLETLVSEIVFGLVCGLGVRSPSRRLASERRPDPTGYGKPLANCRTREAGVACKLQAPPLA